MKVLLHGKNTKNIGELVKSLGFEVVETNPEVVISYGGDGTLLVSERLYPGIPKLPMRNSDICKKCINHDEQTVLNLLKTRKLKQKEYKKLQTAILFKDLFAFNDFVVRNASPIHTIRFKVTVPSHSEQRTLPRKVDSESIQNKLLIGDGIVVSTPWGSTGYFKSITGENFDTGFAVAFNNITERTKNLYLKDKDVVTFQLVRGKATLSWDNNPDIFTIDEGSQLKFTLSNQVAKILEPDTLRCPDCKINRG